jgi:hypothetical protein
MTGHDGYMTCTIERHPLSGDVMSNTV